MFFLIAKSVFVGILFGVLYAFLFFNKLYKFIFGSVGKNIIKYSINTALNFIVLISIFVLLYFVFKINLIITVLSFNISFWVIILYELKTYKK